jgi:hypothetical protein
VSDQYISKYSNNKQVSAAQYITELICEKRAQQQKKDLHYRFWLSKEWSAYYRNQIGSAHKLLQKYGSKAIIAALKHNQAKNIYSLRAPHLVPIIEQEEKKILQQNNQMTIIPDRKINKTFLSNNKNKPSILSKLEDIENDS